ncbi:MAG TPA: ORF6N domain-containing protein [Lacunisphaera sp.]|nr:ORF6N domain-containing protein [Lacunisphaera sp.]
MSKSPSSDPLSGRIFTVRGQRVILDADLAQLYGTTTKRFNESFKRNGTRFPKDFAFQLTIREFAGLRSRIATLDAEPAENKHKTNMWSQIATTSRRRLSNLPWAFTEHGAVMTANVLRSPKAVAMSVYVVRAFVRMRDELMNSAVIFRRLAEIDKKLVTHDVILRDIYEKLRPLLAPAKVPRKEMGFHVGMKKGAKMTDD